jgi:hypothetical protein
VSAELQFLAKASSFFELRLQKLAISAPMDAFITRFVALSRRLIPLRGTSRPFCAK